MGQKRPSPFQVDCYACVHVAMCVCVCVCVCTCEHVWASVVCVPLWWVHLWQECVQIYIYVCSYLYVRLGLTPLCECLRMSAHPSL